MEFMILVAPEHLLLAPGVSCSHEAPLACTAPWCAEAATSFARSSDRLQEPEPDPLDCHLTAAPRTARMHSAAPTAWSLDGIQDGRGGTECIDNLLDASSAYAFLEGVSIRVRWRLGSCAPSDTAVKGRCHRDRNLSIEAPAHLEQNVSHGLLRLSRGGADVVRGHDRGAPRQLTHSSFKS